MMRGMSVMLVVVLAALVSAPLVKADDHDDYGCYNETTHTCDCEATEESCGADGDDSSFWAAFCEDKCGAPEGATVVAGCLKSPEGGDADEAHSCSCSTPNYYCEEKGNLITEACACFIGTYTVICSHVSLSLSLSLSLSSLIHFFTFCDCVAVEVA